MIRGREVKVILLILIEVVFFGCSKIDRYNQIESDYIMDIFSNKDSLSKVINIYFSKEGKYLYLRNSEGKLEAFDIENANLIQKKQEKKKNKVADSSIISSYTLYQGENITLSITERLKFSERKHQMEHSLGVGISGSSFGESLYHPRAREKIKKITQMEHSLGIGISEDNISTGKVDIRRFSKNKVSHNVDKQFKEKLTSINIKKKIKASINADGTVSLYSAVTNKKLLTITLFKNSGSWLAITPKGYYNGSFDAFIYFDVYKYYEKFYRPKIVKLALQGKSIEGLPKISDIKSPPKVEILNGAEETNKKSIEIKVAVTAKNGGIGKIQIIRNGTSIAFETRAFKHQEKEAIKTYEIQLLKGKNEIKAVAFDSSNSVKSESSVYTIRSTYREPHKKSIYALIIGIEKFNNGRFDLKNTIADAKLFEQTLLSQKNNGLFHDVNIVTLITKEETTKENILNELKKMRNIPSEDLFVLYMGSHGEVNDDGKYYLIPSDIDDDSSESIIKHAISEDDIKELVGNIQTAQKFIVFDTCKAGSIANTLSIEEMIKKHKGVDDRTALNTLGHSIGNGAMIMGASTAKEVANEKYKGHGLFTYVLVDGLKGKAETNNEPDIQSSELKDYVYKNVKKISKEVMPRQQTPIINDIGEPFSLSRVK